MWNNIGSYTSFRSVSIANYDAYSSFTIIGGHVFIKIINGILINMADVR